MCLNSLRDHRNVPCPLQKIHAPRESPLSAEVPIYSSLLPASRQGIPRASNITNYILKNLLLNYCHTALVGNCGPPGGRFCFIMQIERKIRSCMSPHQTILSTICAKIANKTKIKINVNSVANIICCSATPSQKYSSRGNRGEVVTSYGEIQGTTWSGGSGGNATVELLVPQEEALTKTYKFMFQRLTDIRDVVSSKIEDLGELLKNHFHIEEFSSVSFPAQETVTVLGQIACDSNGKLNSKSVILEGDREHSTGMNVPVDLTELKDYSLFPGQVVVMEGTNSTGRKFVPTKLYESGFCSQWCDVFTDCPQQMVLAACGPFTTSDSITYDALKDLIDIINRDRPDVCILLGPFLDAKHEQIENLQLTVTFEDVFKRCLKMITEGTRSSGSHLVFVPSYRDVHHHPIYPQPPFNCFEPSKEDRQRIHFVADPCTLTVNGIVLGMTSTDLLFHMGSEEISSTPGAPDRFTRILKHILTQQSYYPLYPPNEDLNIDYESLYSYACMPVTPDIFIIPSELRYFIKDVSGCICINPGRLTKGQVGGTYSRFLIKREAGGPEGRKAPCISAQVVRI
uniref:DNA polymerase alpha subunit B n=1 Tax=Leptobrachium leishanense TaxID=445787 RepID=A0A8C5R590_9ANUR